MLVFNKVKAIIEKYNLLKSGDRVLIGVSGGPDSLALLHILNRIKSKYKLQLYVAHLNHKFRAKAASEDAKFVKETAQKMGLDFYLKEFDVKGYQKDEGLSPEAAAREIRYRFFYELFTEHNFDKIALGHQANDQAETLLIKLLRGSGLQGLKAILPKNGQIIRPLIEVERKEIEDYCQQHSLKPRLDASNLEPIYLRNKIRLELLPLLEAEYNNNIVATLNRSAELLRADNKYLTKRARDLLEQLVKEDDTKFILKRDDFLDLELALKRRLLREIFKEITGDYKDFYYNNIEEVLSFIKGGGTGKKIDLPQEVMLYLNYRQLVFTKEELDSQEEFFKHKLGIGVLNLQQLQLEVSSKVVTKDYPWQKKLGKSNQACFDFDKIGDEFYIRSRKAGDKFYPLNMGGSKKVKDFLIDEKVPIFVRDKVPIFTTESDKIFWVAGYRIDDRFKITDKTENILIIEMIYDNRREL